jgi:predicted ester cyclase
MPIVRTTGVPTLGVMSKRWLPTNAPNAFLIPVVALVVGCAWASPLPARATAAPTEDTMNATTQVTTKANSSALDAATLVARLKKAGEAEVLGAEQTEIDSYFDRKQFRFHAPDGFDTDFAGLNNYFKAVRAAFDDRSIRRGVIVVQGNTVACQTWIEGTFAREFTQSPAGPLPPNGKRVVFDLINIFRFDDQGRMVEEWVRTDYRSFLRQLGAPGR